MALVLCVTNSFKGWTNWRVKCMKQKNQHELGTNPNTCTVQNLNSCLVSCDVNIREDYPGKWKCVSGLHVSLLFEFEDGKYLYLVIYLLQQLSRWTQTKVGERVGDLLTSFSLLLSTTWVGCFFLCFSIQSRKKYLCNCSLILRGQRRGLVLDNSVNNDRWQDDDC